MDNPELDAGVKDPTDTSPDQVKDSQPADTPADPPSSSGTDQPDTPAKGEDPKSMADAIDAALKAAPKEDGNLAPEGDPEPSEDAGEPSDNTDGTDPEKPSEPVEDGHEKTEDDDPTDEELAKMSSGSQKRIKQLLSQRNDARRETEALRTDAGNYQQVREFMTQSRLEDREVAELFQLGADLKSGDPARLQQFVQRVMPTLQAVMEAVGQSVPSDLASKVEAGDMTEDAAKELARYRYEAQTAREQATRANEANATRVTQGQQAEIMSAVETWQSSTRTRDPDFDIKADAMKRAAQAMVAERGLPRTSQEALSMAQEAYREVNQWFKSARPASKPTTATPASGASANRTGMNPQATSLDQVIAQAMAASSRS